MKKLTITSVSLLMLSLSACCGGSDSLVTVPIQALYDYYDQTGPHNASYEIADCSVAGDVAMVRIESKFGENEFSDMFTLVKDGVNWKIVSKVYHNK